MGDKRMLIPAASTVGLLMTRQTLCVAGSAAHAVDVGGHVFGAVQLHHPVYPRKVQPPGSNVCGHQHHAPLSLQEHQPFLGSCCPVRVLCLLSQMMPA